MSIPEPTPEVAPATEPAPFGSGGGGGFTPLIAVEGDANTPVCRPDGTCD